MYKYKYICMYMCICIYSQIFNLFYKQEKARDIDLIINNLLKI